MHALKIEALSLKSESCLLRIWRPVIKKHFRSAC